MVAMLAAYFHATKRNFRNQSSTFLFFNAFFCFFSRVLFIMYPLLFKWFFFMLESIQPM